MGAAGRNGGVRIIRHAAVTAYGGIPEADRDMACADSLAVLGSIA
jgi:hypothetical protein